MGLRPISPLFVKSPKNVKIVHPCAFRLFTKKHISAFRTEKAAFSPCFHAQFTREFPSVSSHNPHTPALNRDEKPRKNVSFQTKETISLKNEKFPRKQEIQRIVQNDTLMNTTIYN